MLEREEEGAGLELANCRVSAPSPRALGSKVIDPSWHTESPRSCWHAWACACFEESFSDSTERGGRKRCTHLEGDFKKRSPFERDFHTGTDVKHSPFLLIKGQERADSRHVTFCVFSQSGTRICLLVDIMLTELMTSAPPRGAGAGSVCWPLRNS